MESKPGEEQASWAYVAHGAVHHTAKGQAHKSAQQEKSDEVINPFWLFWINTNGP